jgi:serine/threonine-protein kinase
MLTGRTVFTGEPMAVMIHHARTAPQPPSKFRRLHSERLEQIVLACLEKTADKRPSSAMELWRELGEVPLSSPWTAERAELWWCEHLPELTRPSIGTDSTGELSAAPLC